MEYRTELIPRILRDIDDGVLALDPQGHIIYVNPQCEGLLGLGDRVLGKTYGEVFFASGQGEENDSFHQFLFDAVYHKDSSHRGTVTYVGENGEKRYLHITSSFLKNGETRDSAGVVMVISDVTEGEIQKRKRRDAVITYSCVTVCVCLYLLLVTFLDFVKVEVPTKALTQVINGMVLVIGVIIYRTTDFSVYDLGLKIPDRRQTFVPAAVISAGAVALLAGGKLLLMEISPGFFGEGTPFWNWNIGAYSWISYVFTCIIQEFLARSMIYGSIRKMFDGKYGTAAAVAISSLLFGAVHIAHGFLYMAAAIVLLGLLGGLYERQRNIWGVAVIHYVLGQAACCLGFLSA